MTGLPGRRLSEASENAVAMWTALARARGDRVEEHPTFTTIDGRRFRIMVRTATPDHAELAALAQRQRETGRTVVVEDPFQVLDLSGTGMTAGQLPVMVREPAEVPDEPAVVRLHTAADLRKAEEIIVHGFPLEEYQPLEAGHVFPAGVRNQDFFLKDGQGACLTMTHAQVAGVYWVTTMPEHRSKGVGRALMHAVLRHFDDRPVTLTASRSGKPLYDKLGFTTLGDANWWR